MDASRVWPSPDAYQNAVLSPHRFLRDARLHSAHLGTGTEAVSQLVEAMLTNSSSFSFVSLYMSHFEAESLSGGLASQNQHRGEFGFACDMFTSLSVSHPEGIAKPES